MPRAAELDEPRALAFLTFFWQSSCWFKLSVKGRLWQNDLMRRDWSCWSEWLCVSLWCQLGTEFQNIVFFSYLLILESFPEIFVLQLYPDVQPEVEEKGLWVFLNCFLSLSWCIFQQEISEFWGCDSCPITILKPWSRKDMLHYAI